MVQAAKDAGQRLGHRSLFDTDAWRDNQHVGIDDAARNPNVFGVSAVVEQEIFAEVLLMFGAVEAHLARRGIQGDDAHAFLESVDTGSYFLDDSGQFMAEQGGRHDHAGMVAALVHLKISAAGQGNLNFDQNLAFSHARDRYFLNLEVFFAVQDGCGHFSVHCWLPSQRLPG
jgi:hypothetical protein